jgi:hypothetical protein
MNTRKNIIIASIALMFMMSCELDTNRPIENDGTPPGEVMNIEVESLAGAAKISYSLPSDPDLLYVEAVYKTSSGKKMEFKSSYYTNFLIVEGFADTTTHEVTLRTVDRSGNYSSSVTVPVTPKTPPVVATYQSLSIKPDFGGVVINFKNETKADLAIVVMTPDSTGKMAVAKTYYTSRDSAGFSVRGFASEPRKFNVYVRDRWNNVSDVLEEELIPIFEVQLDKSKFQPLELPGDSPCTSWGGAMPYVWDGRVTGDIAGFGLHTGNASTTVPKVITFDLGVEAQLSRFSLQTVADDRHWFNDVSPRRYEVWGALEPAADGSFNGWTKLLSITNIKPSGLPIGLFTDDDRAAGLIGDEANFPTDIPKVRYIRIRCLENWSGNTNMVFSEVTFWGNDQ